MACTIPNHYNTQLDALYKILMLSSFQIEDMVNTTVLQTVEQALLQTEGVTGVTITTAGDVHIEYDNTALGPRDILKIVQVSLTKMFKSLFRGINAYIYYVWMLTLYTVYTFGCSS